jgi:DNA mismatch repair protein MutS2
MIREARELADHVQKELRELEKIRDSKDRNKRYEEVRRKIRGASDRYRETLAVAENPDPVGADELKVGDRVKVLSLDQTGNVLTLPDDRNELLVQAGPLKISVNLSNLSKLSDGGGKRTDESSRYGALYRSKVQSVVPSVNVRGSLLDDALMDVDKYLDDAFIAGLKEVTVIHGRGEGILRGGIQRMLKGHKHVAGFRKGAYNEGGDGVTIVQLK